MGAKGQKAPAVSAEQKLYETKPTAERFCALPRHHESLSAAQLFIVSAFAVSAEGLRESALNNTFGSVLPPVP